MLTLVANRLLMPFPACKTQKKTSTISQLLRELEKGDTQAFNQLYLLVCEELKGLAAIQRARWHGNFTINTTALVHEAYEKLVRAPNKKWEDRRHFYRVAARAMRQILFSYAESKNAQKRGGKAEHVPIEDEELTFNGVFEFSEKRVLDGLAMEDAMRKLELISPREAQITACRF